MIFSGILSIFDKRRRFIYLIEEWISNVIVEKYLLKLLASETATRGVL